MSHSSSRILRSAFRIILLVLLAIGFFAVYNWVSSLKLPLFTKSEPTSTVVKTEIGDFKDILQLSVLDVDIEDAYQVKVNNRLLIYKIPAHCEFKYDLKRVGLEETDSSIIVTLPRCEPEVTTVAKSLTILYEEEGTFSPNATDEGDKQAINILTDEIRKRVGKEYQDLAFEQAKHLLESFYSNAGKKHVIVKRR